MAWPDRKILDLFGIDLPIVQAPMANFGTPEMAIGAAEAGALGSLPCASLNADQIRAAIAAIRKSGVAAAQSEFLLPRPPPADAKHAKPHGARRLAPYYRETGI